MSDWKINKTFTFGGKPWALASRGKETLLMRRNHDGLYEPVNGLRRNIQEAFEYALKRWPEYLERPK